MIALLMGIFAAMPSRAGGPTCGHLLDQGKAHKSVECRSELHDRRIEVVIAASVAGTAAIVGSVAYAAALKERR
jgi:hypothetical protein